MNDLINELKSEHRRVEDIFSNLEKNGATTAKGLKTILESKQMLFQHLEKENQQLYPVLRECAKTDKLLKRTLDTFAHDMEDVLEVIREFYDKYTVSIDNYDEFLKDMLRTKMLLKKRIMNEEIILYRAYNQHKNR